MRSLFHFPFPCTTTLAATVPLQPEMCHRPHSAPMRRQRRSPALLSAAARPPVPRLPDPGPLSPAPRAPAMPRPPILALRRCPHRAHRAPTSASLYVATEQIPRASPPITPTVRRHPHRAHRAPPPSYTCCASPSASLPPRADIRVTPPSLSSRCVGPGALAGKNRTVCIPFSPNARKRPPSWQHPPEMHAFRDQDGNILALCIHFRAQSGDSGCMARESCRQGPSFASRNPKPRMARRCCRRRAAFPRQRPAVRPNGLCAMRQRHATRGMAERALRPAARAWPACRMRAPCHLACACRPRSSPLSYTRRASPPASRPRTQPSAKPPIAVGMSCQSGSSCRPRAAHADASRYPRAAPIPPAERTHRVQETSGTTQATQCEHKNRIPKWGPY